MDTWKNPYKDMKFDPTPFDKEITKTKESFDQTIQDAGTQAGMASGMSGMNVGRVTADTYARAMGGRDASIANLEGQKAVAQTQFDAQKQQAVAQAEAEYQRNKPGFWDWASGGLQLATSIATMNPFGILGGAGKMATNIKGGMVKPNINPINQSKPIPVTSETTVPTGDINNAVNSFNFAGNMGFGKIKRKTNTTGFGQTNYNWGIR